MLKEVQGFVLRIEEYLKDNPNFETVADADYLTIQVFPRNGTPTTYHGYELHLMEEVVKKLNSTLDFKVTKTDEDIDTFIITSEANFNLESYITATNRELDSFKDDAVHTIFLGTKLTQDARGDFVVLTGLLNGEWTRYELTKAELLYAAVHNFKITPNSDGVFWFAELIEMNNQYFNEYEAAQKPA